MKEKTPVKLELLKLERESQAQQTAAQKQIAAMVDELESVNEAVKVFSRYDLDEVRQRELRKYWKQFSDGGGF